MDNAQVTTRKPGRGRKIAVAAAVNLFLLIWLSAMAAGLAAGACMNLKRSEASRLRACSIAIVVGTPFRADRREAAKTSFLFLERAILRAEHTPDLAKADMRTAIHNATYGAPHLARLVRRIGQEDPTSPAARLWSEALGDPPTSSKGQTPPSRN